MQFSIRQARVHAGLTQKKMAEYLGIDRGTYFKIEKDPLRATVRQVNKISEITGIPVEDIFLPMYSTKVDISQEP